jgi:NTE family protein
MNHRLNHLQTRRVGLALSGGGVRGLAHIGVIKVLSEVGIEPAVVAGTSAGSIIGAGLAAGMGWRELAEMARSVFWPSLLRGGRLERLCAAHLPESFERLHLPFAAIATAVPSKRMITLTAGPLASAISASCAIPGVRLPVARDGWRLWDGGVVCVVPAPVCRELGAEFVISSDVWEWSALLRTMGLPPAQQRYGFLYPAHYRRALRHTDLLVHPAIPVTSYLPNAAAVARLIAAGERAARHALSSWSRGLE